MGVTPPRVRIPASPPRTRTKFDPYNMTLLELILIFAIIIFLGYFIKSLTGFAGGLFSVPFLAIFFDIKFVVPIVSIIDMLSGFILFPSIKKHINKNELLFVLIGALIGTAIGTYFLKAIAGDTLKLLFGIFVIIFSLKMLFEKYFFFNKIKTVFGIFFGMLGGMAGGMFSTNGPPIVLYLGHQVRNKQILRGTLITIFLVDSIWRNGLYFFTGIFDNSMYKVVLFMIPVLVVATIIGSKIHLKLSEEIYRKTVGTILLISGIILLI